MIWNNFNYWDTIWDDIHTLHNRLNRSTRLERKYPGIRLYRQDGEYLLQSELPGVTPEELDITIQEAELTFKFKRTAANSEEAGRKIRRERGEGEFTRTLQLPFRIAADRAAAELKNGILTLRLPLHEADRPQKVAIKAA